MTARMKAFIAGAMAVVLVGMLTYAGVKSFSGEKKIEVVLSVEIIKDQDYHDIVAQLESHGLTSITPCWQAGIQEREGAFVLIMTGYIEKNKIENLENLKKIPRILSVWYDPKWKP